MKRPLIAILFATLLLACGDDDDDDDNGGVDASASVDAPAGQPDAAGGQIDAAIDQFTLTSTAFSEGGVIPDKHSCQGDNVSPALSWSGGPEAGSYAIVFRDETFPLIHSVIWDIPGNVSSLPEGVENAAEPSVPDGAKQTFGYDGSTRGYLGPCPGSTHTYEFVIYAFAVNPMPDVNLDSTRAQVEAKAQALAIDTASLSGTFTP